MFWWKVEYYDYSELYDDRLKPLTPKYFINEVIHAMSMLI